MLPEAAAHLEMIAHQQKRQPARPAAPSEYNAVMSTARYVHWQDDGMWLGYFEEFPDYLTQGETVEELRENLRDLYKDLTSGEIPGIRRVAEMSLG
jgi:predicted RNase H-like HicB family nuclease